MYYLKFGNSKKFIVFLHGWGADLNSFLWLKDFFVDDYSLIFLDFEGFGKSKENKNAMFVADYVNNLYTLLSNYEIDELTFVAHSFGGRVAIKYLFFHQSEYKNVKLCLVDSAGINPRRGLRYYFKVKHYKWLKRKAEINQKLKNKLNDFGSDDYKKLSPIMKETFKNVVNEDLSCYAKFIKCKTIIIWGKDDKETKMYMAKKLNKLIVNSELKVIDNAGHFCFLEKKEEFVIILDTFMKN